MHRWSLLTLLIHSVCGIQYQSYNGVIDPNLCVNPYDINGIQQQQRRQQGSDEEKTHIVISSSDFEEVAKLLNNHQKEFSVQS